MATGLAGFNQKIGMIQQLGDLTASVLIAAGNLCYNDLKSRW